MQEKTIEFGADPGLTEEWVTYIRTFAHVVSATATISGVCRDPDDDKFLDAALGGQASHIVSSDHDLQALGEYQSIKVLSPREFAELLELISPFTSPSDT